MDHELCEDLLVLCDRLGGDSSPPSGQRARRVTGLPLGLRSSSGLSGNKDVPGHGGTKTAIKADISIELAPRTVNWSPVLSSVTQ